MLAARVGPLFLREPLCREPTEEFCTSLSVVFTRLHSILSWSATAARLADVTGPPDRVTAPPPRPTKAADRVSNRLRKRFRKAGHL
jgi:hypothetical protein